MEGMRAYYLDTIIPYMVYGRKSNTTYWITTDVTLELVCSCLILPDLWVYVNPVQSCCMLL